MKNGLYSCLYIDVNFSSPALAASASRKIYSCHEHATICNALTNLHITSVCVLLFMDSLMFSCRNPIGCLMDLPPV